MSKYIKLDNNALTNMTEFLKRHFSVDERDTISCIECRSLAEKILSSLPTIEVGEDCISRADLMKELRKDAERVEIEEFACDTVWRTISNAPSVVPSRAEGEWVIDEPPSTGHGAIYTCPFCGHEEFEPTNLCPACGEKMKG